MSTINKKSRKPYRILTDVKNKIWDEIHFLTDARSVDAADGADLETKVGAIKGITSSSSVTEAGYAVDAAALNSRLGNQEFGFDSDGKFAHREAGADTWVPFKENDKNLTPVSVSLPYTPTENDMFASIAVNAAVAVYGAGGNETVRKAVSRSVRQSSRTLTASASHTRPQGVCCVSSTRTATWDLATDNSTITDGGQIDQSIGLVDGQITSNVSVTILRRS